jgi:hypothetical protein
MNIFAIWNKVWPDTENVRGDAQAHGRCIVSYGKFGMLYTEFRLIEACVHNVLVGWVPVGFYKYINLKMHTVTRHRLDNLHTPYR